ncbi:MAG: rod shape-determining protein MreD [Pseudomonadota bacterium]
MGSTATGYIWAMRALYAMLMILILFLQLLPLETTPRGWAAPDFLLCLTMVWVARRPELAPIWLVAALFLLADLLLQRPPGLWAALALVATEVLRARASDLRETVFAFEWLMVSAILLCFYVALMICWAVMVPYDISNSLLALQLLLTILLYPALAGLSGMLFRVSNPVAGQTDVLGRKA